MQLVGQLRAEAPELIDQATSAVDRASLQHYSSDHDTTRDRLADLFETLFTCLETRTVTPMIQHAESVSNERFHAGVCLEEVQTAFNAVEETLWLRLVSAVPAEQLAESLSPVATVLGAGKDQLARSYVHLAVHHKAPAMDVTALFDGACAGA